MSRRPSSRTQPAESPRRACQARPKLVTGPGGRGGGRARHTASDQAANGRRRTPLRPHARPKGWARARRTRQQTLRDAEEGRRQKNAKRGSRPSGARGMSVRLRRRPSGHAATRRAGRALAGRRDPLPPTGARTDEPGEHRSARGPRGYSRGTRTRRLVTRAAPAPFGPRTSACAEGRWSRSSATGRIWRGREAVVPPARTPL